MNNGKCTKRYPRLFLNETQTGQDGYPLYRWRSPEDGGFTASKMLRGSSFVVDISWIVPYCPLLSRIFNTSINVEFCNSVKYMTYICKYGNKGLDMAVYEIATNENDHDEVRQYQMGRYISSNEAVWIFLFTSVTQLVVHLAVHL